MLWQIELLYFAAMIATFVVLLLVAKMPSGIALMCSALVGMTLGAIFEPHTGWSLRYLIEGGFGYFDTILVIVAAMIFIQGLKSCGSLDYLTALLVKAFKKTPTILLLAFMLLVMLPGMITGSSLAAIVSSGAIVAPIMLKMGLPKKKVGAIIAFGAVLGMIAPPINVPVMVICDVVDIPYTGFTLPLLCLTIPLAIFAVLWLSRTFKKEEGKTEKNLIENLILTSVLGLTLIVFVILTFVLKTNSDGKSLTKLLITLTVLFAVVFGLAIVAIWVGHSYTNEINLDELKGSVDLDMTSNPVNLTLIIPLATIVILFLLQALLPRSVGMLGSPLLFLIAFIPTIFVGNRNNPLFVIKEGVQKSLSAMALLIGVGMFVEVFTLVGARGYFVINALSLPNLNIGGQFKYLLQFVAILIAVPIFGGISAFGSASILGGPFVMALVQYNEIVVSSAISLIAAVGEFLPPTAMSATFSAKMVNEALVDVVALPDKEEQPKEEVIPVENSEGDIQQAETPVDEKKSDDIKYIHITKTSIVPLAITLAYALAFIMFVAVYWPE